MRNKPGVGAKVQKTQNEIKDSPKWLQSHENRGLSGDFETTVCAPILLFRGPFDWILDHGYNPVESGPGTMKAISGDPVTREVRNARPGSEFRASER